MRIADDSVSKLMTDRTYVTSKAASCPDQISAASHPDHAANISDTRTAAHVIFCSRAFGKISGIAIIFFRRSAMFLNDRLRGNAFCYRSLDDAGYLPNYRRCI